MTSNLLDMLPAIVFVAVMFCWFLFAGVFIFRKKPPQPPERKRERASLVGMALQGTSYAVVWSIHRRFFSPIAPMRAWLEITVAVGTVTIAAASVWITLSAMKTLGKQWSYVARLVEGHKLVTEGPYRLVRHPIYTGMLGLVIATGLAISHWLALVAAVIVYAIGTAIRVRIEERLLREAFGVEFEDYSRRVSAVIPGLR